jgi:D-glycero-D-manno-heptose 1,7-bisphosphate phosphatase
MSFKYRDVYVQKHIISKSNTDHFIPHYFLDTSGDYLHILIPDNLEYAFDSGNLFEHMQSLDGRIALIDRDGVVIEKAPYHQYHKHAEDMKVIGDVSEAIRILNQRKIPAVLMTNQPGIYKKQLSETDFYHMTFEIQNQLGGAKIDAVIFCPHPAPTEGDNVSSDKLCMCRKPKPGMIYTILELFKGNKDTSKVFGDFLSDIDAAYTAGVPGVYIATKHDEYETMHKQIVEKYPTIEKYNTLEEAVKAWITA